MNGVFADSTESSVALQWNLSRSLMGRASSIKERLLKLLLENLLRFQVPDALLKGRVTKKSALNSGLAARDAEGREFAFEIPEARTLARGVLAP